MYLDNYSTGKKQTAQTFVKNADGTVTVTETYTQTLSAAECARLKTDLANQKTAAQAYNPTAVVAAVDADLVKLPA